MGPISNRAGHALTRTFQRQPQVATLMSRGMQNLTATPWTSLKIARTIAKCFFWSMPAAGFVTGMYGFGHGFKEAWIRGNNTIDKATVCLSNGYLHGVESGMSGLFWPVHLGSFCKAQVKELEQKIAEERRGY